MIRRRAPLVGGVAWVLAIAAVPGGWCQVVAGEGYQGVEARIGCPSRTVQPGKPVLVELTLHNTTDKPVVLSVPGVTPEQLSPVLGLPLAHVFSGQGFAGLIVRGDMNRTWSDAFEYQPPTSAPDIVLAPHGLVGTQLDATAYYPPLRSPGVYRLVWQPYGGLVVSNQLTIEVAPIKHVVLLTDEGELTIKLFYDLAPNHVANFLELVRNGFYNQKSFHRIEPGFFIQGGCPNGNGTGIRLDGKKLKAEFSERPHDRGVVSMARLEGDPDSASCQFIIANTRIPDWDGKYSVFGELVGDDSFSTLDRLMSTPIVPETGRPERSLYIRAARIVDAPQDETATAETPAKRG